MLLHLTQNILRFATLGLLLSTYQFANAQEGFVPPRPNLDGWDCAVRGRVVDDTNKPVAHARIVLDDTELVFFSESDADGHFIRESHCWRSPMSRVLFVTSSFAIGGIVPIDPPDYYFWKLGEAFAGKPIVLKKNEVLDVGDVRVQVYYSKLAIRFQNSNGKPLFGGNMNWRLVWLRVRNERHRVVAETSLPFDNLEPHVRKAENIIIMYLPEGEWHLEISPFENKGPWLKASGPVVVRRSNQPLTVTLRMAK